MTSFFSAECGPIWIKFRRLVHNDMSTVVIIIMVKIGTRCRIPIMADVWANSMACHPTATCHIAECNNSIRHIENHFSPYFIFFCFCNAVWASTSGGFRIVSDTFVFVALL